MSTLSLASSPSPALSPRQVLHSTHPTRGATLLPSNSSIASSTSTGSAHSNHHLYYNHQHQHHQSSISRVGPSATPPPRQLAPPTTTFTTTITAVDNHTSPKFVKYYHSTEHDAPAPRRPVRYTDSATQYSPEWSPPTANPALEHSYHKNKSRAVEIPAVVAAATTAKVVQQPDPMTGVDSSPSSSSSISNDTNTHAVSTTTAQHASSSQTTQSQHDANNHDHYNGPRAVPSSSMAETSPVQEARSTDVQPSASKRSRPDPATWKVMPYKYELSSPKDLGALISNMLMELIRINDKIPLRDGRLTRFHSRAPPGISVSDYLQRLIQHATLSPPILLSMVYYIDRLCTMYPAFTINSLTVHRFLITAATVAAKGLSDSFWTNPTYARIGGIPVPELATLELELLQRVQWKIVPKPEALEDYYYSLVERTDGYVLEQAASGSESSRSLGDSVLTSSQERGDIDQDGDAEMAGGPT